MRRIFYRHLSRSPQWTAALSLLLVTAACSQATPLTTAGQPPSHEAKVQLSLVTQTIPFSEGYAVLDATAIETLDAFLNRHAEGGQRPILRIYALAPLVEDADTVAITDNLMTQRQAVVADYAAARGFQSDLLPPRAAADGTTDDVVVEVARYIAVPPACPDWSDASESNFNNAPSSNFGCASARNLSLMVADPRDLIQGRALGPAEAARLAKALEKYQQGHPLEINQESTGQ